jgi:hypothetical protein
VLRIRQREKVLTGLIFLAIGLYGLEADKDSVIVVGALISGVLRVAAGLLRDPPVVVPGPEGPGTLAATPTGRFRATGWPPSKNPDDYR